MVQCLMTSEATPDRWQKGGRMRSDIRLARHYVIRAWLILFAGLYLLVFHVLWASRACLPSLCLPPSPIVPPSPVVVAWADLIVGILYVAIGIRGVWPRLGNKAS